MNRIIKFRGKRLQNGEPTNEWVYGSLSCDYGGVDETSLFKDSLDPELYSVGIRAAAIYDPRTHETYPVLYKTVSQFTGYRDIDNTEIYEGDIVSVRHSVTATVEWRGGGFHFYGLKSASGRRPDYVPSRTNQMRVIGNIYDNHVKLD